MRLLQCCIAALAAIAILAATPPPLPGLGPDDRRILADPATAPWRSLGKLQATAVSVRVSCTAALVAPKTVLTAAHCLFNPRVGHYFPAAAAHFLLGYDRGRFVAHAAGVRLTIAPGYDPARPLETIGNDWALVGLDQAIGTPDRILALASAPPAGATVSLGGYAQDRAAVLAVDPACRLLGEARDGDGRPLLRHDCAGTHGTSGGPLLWHGSQWSIVGVNVAAQAQGQGGVAAMIEDVANRLRF